MATLYRRPRSPFWWVRYTDPAGRVIRQSTKFRVNSERETAQAEVHRANLALGAVRDRAPAYDWSWVDDWLPGHCRSPRTLSAYRLHWRHIQHWMRTAAITHPKQITYRHGHDYVAFRTGARSGHKTCSKNTALVEVKFLGQLLRQCLLRGEIATNPIQRLGIRRDEPTEKRELTDTEITTCLAALPDEPEWLRLSFLIGLHTGLRLRETRLRLSFVDFSRRIITVESPKGGKSRAFSRPLPEALIPILHPIRSRAYTHEFPFQPSRCFQNFFHRLQIFSVSFHCLRVTYVTRLHRAGVPLSAAMRLVNHSSQLVHRIYTRLGVDDVRSFADVPLFATTPENSTAAPDSQPAGNPPAPPTA